MANKPWSLPGNMQRQQLALALTVAVLHVACALLKPGGRLVYSTCTMNPLENESNVAYAIRSLPLRLIAAEPRVGPPGRKGCGLTEEERQMVQRFEPDGELDTNGFFIAAFQKIV